MNGEAHPRGVLFFVKENTMANFTEKAIKESFAKLLNERPLDKITVKDIVEDCGINRNSFYYVRFGGIFSIVTFFLAKVQKFTR